METRSTTILAVRKNGETVIGGDGQVTVGSSVIKHRARKIRKLYKALLLAVDKEHMLLISGNGDIIEPDEPVLGIGSGGDYARSSALALYRNTDLSAEEIVRKSLEIASEICIYTNAEFVIERI